MNEQNFGELVNTSDIIERTDQGTNSSEAVDSNSFADIDKAPVLATLIYETPIGGNVGSVGTIDETIPFNSPVAAETIVHVAPIGTNGGSAATLLNNEESEHFRNRWNEIQGKFVDEPRSAVQQADALVSEVSEKITQLFINEHSSLEGQWNQGNDVSTEDLRKALQRYRSFFNRLVV